jgi:hypothetical protein
MNNFSKIDNQEIRGQSREKTLSVVGGNFAKRISLTVIVLIMVLFSWTGTVDKASEAFIDSSLKQAAIVYGTARAINATVSVLQTVSIPGLGLGIGQGLDPLNSIVERFSTIMEISIGSLVIQKILIEISTNYFFNILLTISAGTILISIFFKDYIDLKLLVRIFLSLAFLRYLIVFSLMINGVISNAFIKDKINIEADIIYTASTEASSEIDKHNQAKKELNEIKNQFSKDNENSVVVPLPEASAAQPIPTDKSMWEKAKEAVLGQPNTNSTQPSGSDVVQKTNLEKAKDWFNKQNEKIKIMLDNFNPMKVAEKIQQVVGNMINLMAIILLQTLLLPIFFMYLLKWVVFVIWNVRFDNLPANIRLDSQ